MGKAEARRAGHDPEALLAAIERATQAGLAAVDADGVQTYANPAFCRMLGFAPEELIGQRAPFPYWPVEERARIEEAFAATVAGTAPEDGFELRFCRKDGARIDVQLLIGAIVEDGQPAGWLASVQDITARKRALATLADAQRLASVGTWEWDVASGEVRWSRELFHQYGRDPDSFTPSYEGFLAQVIDEDRPRVQEALRRTLEEGREYAIELRIRRPDGEVRVQQTLGRLERDDAGRPLRMFGTTQDITERKRLEEERLGDTVHRIAASFAHELEEGRLVARIVDEAVSLAAAASGALVVDGAARGGDLAFAEAIEAAPALREAIGAAWRAGESVRRDDVGADAALSEGAPASLVSLLAVPIRSRTGEVLGGLVLGHPRPGRFTARVERLIAGLTAQAAVALDNARLYGKVRQGQQAAQLARAEAERTASILADQRSALEQIASGAPLGSTLETLIESIERHADGALRGSVLLFDAEARVLRHGAAPSLPPAYNAAIDGVAIGPAVGSCGTAAHDDREVLVVDIETDPLWADYRDLALGHGLRACWSTPIHASDGAVLGTFAIYYDSPRAPTDEERQIVGTLNRTAAIAIERTRVEEELRAANQRKDEFLALLGHELRNPLAPILTALELMEDDGAHGEERAAIERHVGHMIQLVDDLLDISRITRGKVEIERRPVPLSEAVEAAVELASPLFEKRAHHLSVEVPDVLCVDGDRIRLAQIFANLLTNAAKYTDPGGRVTVRAAREAEEAVVRVTDDGMGIEPALLPRIFEPFTQGVRGIDRLEGGLGLGLPLVRSLVELHGGVVSVRSDGVGRGTEVEVRLPLGRQAREAEPAPPRPSRPSPSGAPLLVVDDNEDAAMMLARMLGRAGYEVTVAHDGPSALARAAETRFELAVVDIGLPVMDGYELGRRLLEIAPTRLVAVTGYGQASDRRRSAEAGFAAHLVKPVRKAELLEALEG